MKRILVSTWFLAICSTLVLGGGVAGTWNAKIETENGPWEFSVVYKVDGEKITGEFITDYGNLEFGPGEIKGKKFEYSFEIEYVTYTHKGELISENEILIQSTSEGEEAYEFTLKRDLPE